MIRVDRLCKRYGPTVALDGISFDVRRGDIVGLLGPNGAGKSTTMRILTGFMPATSGTATVAGHDVFKDSLAVRRQIGYLPEGVPLYPEMRVEEYLTFRARIKGVPRKGRTQRVAGAMARCAVADVRRKLIGALSKGYRQRVGLADALVSDPPVLVLDEPTIGLDPNQIREVRKLIRELGEEHTVILSTHILPEVEAVCKRVLLIHNGRLVYQDTLEEIARHGAGGMRIILEVRAPVPVDGAVLRRLAGVLDLSVEEGGGVTRFAIKVEPDADIRNDVLRCAVDQNWTVLELHRIKPSLEDVFVHLTVGEES